MSKSIKPKDFANEAHASYAFLLQQGFVMIKNDTYRCAYADDSLTVTVVYNAREGSIDTAIRTAHANAGIHCLYVESGLGPAQDIRSVARSSYTLRSAFASQAIALKKVLSVLEGERRDELLVTCHGR